MENETFHTAVLAQGCVAGMHTSPSVGSPPPPRQVIHGAVLEVKLVRDVLVRTADGGVQFVLVPVLVRMPQIVVF